MSQVMTRCADLLSSLYAPIPEDSEDEDAGVTATYSLNSTSEMERGNRHVRENALLGFHLARLKSFLRCNSGYGVRLEPRQLLLYQPRMLDDRAVGGTRIGRGDCRKICPNAIFHPNSTCPGNQPGTPKWEPGVYTARPVVRIYSRVVQFGINCRGYKTYTAYKDLSSVNFQYKNFLSDVQFASHSWCQAPSAAQDQISVAFTKLRLS
jgi:hypothetical protein